jgi:uncharacterized membrane protein YeaQ/YmgE (transglycosylase-associated protein family)
MLSNLDFGWLAMAVAAVAIFSFIFGLALDALISDDGFGAIGNMLVLTVGFFLAIVVANRYGHDFDELLNACLFGLGGAFTCFSALTLAKAGLSRL